MTFSKIEYPLNELADFIDYRGKTPIKTTSGIPLITAKIVKGGFIETPNEFISPADYESWMVRGIPMIGDVVLTTEAPLGEVAQLKSSNVALAQRIITLRSKSNLLDNCYLKYFLQSQEGQRRLREKETGTTVTGIKQSELRKLLIPLPKYETQTRIAEILSSLDDKIELNRQMNQTLEEMAQALYKHYFVDGIDPENLPEGWQEGEIQDCFNITIGRTPPRMEKEWFSTDQDDIKWISIKDIGNAGAHIFETAENLTQESVTRFNIPMVEPNTVIVSFKLTVGRVCITTEKMLTNEAIAHLNPLNEMSTPKEYVYLYMKNFNYDVLGSTSSIATAINSKMIKAMPFLIPARDIMDTFVAKTEAIFELIKSNHSENINLSQIRDYLLPKLISGEILPKDLKQIEAVL